MKQEQLKPFIERFSELYGERLFRYGNEIRVQTQAEFDQIIQTLNQALSRQEKEALADYLFDQWVKIKICTTCESIMTEGFVIYEPHQTRYFCCEACMFEAGITMQLFNQNYDEEGHELDPCPNPDWESYEYDWCQ